MGTNGSAFALLAAACAAGCAPDLGALTLGHLSSLTAETRGVVLADDGARGHAGMFGVTCDFSTRTGETGTDYDFAADDELVLDGRDDPELGFVTVALTEGRLHLTALDSGRSWDLRLPNVVGGALTDDWIVALRATRSGCAAELAPYPTRARDPGELLGPGRVPLPDAACSGTAALAADRAGNAVFVATGDDVLRISPAEATSLGIAADDVAFDAWSGALYAFRVGGQKVTAVESDGALRWTATVDGEIASVGHLGAFASAAVAVRAADPEDERGAVVVLDGVTGQMRSTIDTPTAPLDLAVAGEGHVLGLVREQEVHFYEVGPEG